MNNEAADAALRAAGIVIEIAESLTSLPRLILVAVEGWADAASVLIKAGAAVDVRCPKGITPLHNATANGHTAVVDVLIKAGANVDLVDRQGFSALHNAVLNGHIDIVKLLLAAGASTAICSLDGKIHVMHNAMGSNGIVEIVQMLLDAGADVDPRQKNGSSPLHVGARYRSSAVQLVISAGADVNALNGRGHTPLHSAVLYDSVTEVDVLLRNGARHDILDSDGCTPLGKAKSDDIIELLLVAGADPCRGVKDGEVLKPMLRWCARSTWIKCAIFSV